MNNRKGGVDGWPEIFYYPPTMLPIPHASESIGPIRHSPGAISSKHTPSRTSSKTVLVETPRNVCLPNQLVSQPPLHPQTTGIFPVSPFCNQFPNQNNFLLSGLPPFMQAYWHGMTKRQTDIRNFISISNTSVENCDSICGGPRSVENGVYPISNRQRLPGINPSVQNVYGYPNEQANYGNVANTIPTTPLGFSYGFPPNTQMMNNDVQFLGVFKKNENENLTKTIGNISMNDHQETKLEIAENQANITEKPESSPYRSLHDRLMEEHNAQMSNEIFKRNQLNCDLAIQKIRADSAETRIGTIAIYNKNLRKISKKNQSQIANLKKIAANCMEKSQAKQKKVEELTKENLKMMVSVGKLKTALNFATTQAVSQKSAFEKTIHDLRQEKVKLEAKSKASDQECGTWKKKAEEQKKVVKERDDELMHVKKERDDLSKELQTLQHTLADFVGKFSKILPSDMVMISEQNQETTTDFQQ